MISTVGEGMTLRGDCHTEGSLIVEGTVIGQVYACRTVVIGEQGVVDGKIYAEDLVVAGRALGSAYVRSRVELQSTGYLSGEVIAPVVHLGAGAKLAAQVSIGESPVPSAGAKSAYDFAPTLSGRGHGGSPDPGLGATP